MFAYFVVNLVVYSFFSARSLNSPTNLIYAAFLENKQWDNLNSKEPFFIRPTTEFAAKTSKIASLMTGYELNERPNKPLLSYMQPSLKQIIPSTGNNSFSVLSRAISHDRKIKKQQLKSGYKFPISTVGIYIIIVFSCVVSLVFIVVFIYAQQHDQLSQRPNETNNSHVSEARQLLKNRLYVVKRHIPYHFEVGLPCPE